MTARRSPCTAAVLKPAYNSSLAVELSSEDSLDPVTHFLTGACMGRSGFNRKSALATVTMVLAAEAADIDVLWEIQRLHRRICSIIAESRIAS